MSDVTSWDELQKRYSLKPNSSDGAGSGDDPWKNLQDKYSAKLQAPADATTAPSLTPQGSWTDAPNTLGTGMWRGALRTLGLPVDTVSNVLDLIKAPAGIAYHEATGKPIPDWLAPSNRKQQVGSSDWMLDKARQTSLGRFMLDPANPAMEGSPIQTFGEGAGGAVSSPGTAVQAFNRFLLGGTSAVAGRKAYELTGDPSAAIAATLITQSLPQAAGAATKYAIRGDEAGRRAMEQRVSDLQAAGVQDPTLGLASGNKMLGATENLLASTPGAVGTMARARNAAVQGMQSTAEEAANTASPVRGATASGRAITQDINGPFLDAFRQQQQALYNRLGQFVPAETPVAVGNTKDALYRLTQGIPDAPNLGDRFINGRIAGIKGDFDLDTGLVRPQNAGPTPGEGPWRPPAIPQLPYSAVSKLRTQVGNELSNNSLVADVPRSQWKQVYGALSEDMQGAANAAGPQAAQAWSRANDYTKAGTSRLERVQPFTSKDDPAQAFTALMNTTGENVSTLRAVKRSVTPETWGTVAGTVIDRMGKAAPGQQNETADVWSPDRFLSAWVKMTPEAQKELTSGYPGADAVRAKVEAVARGASLMRDNSKLWANPSGTAAALTARGTIGLVPAAFVYDVAHGQFPWTALGAAGSLLGTRAAAQAVTSPTVRDWAMRAPEMPSLTSIAPRVLGLNSSLLAAMQPNPDGLDPRVSASLLPEWMRPRLGQ